MSGSEGKKAPDAKLINVTESARSAATGSPPGQAGRVLTAAGQKAQLDIGGDGSKASADPKKEDSASASERIQAIIAGFKINHMNIRDASNGRIMWELPEWPSLKEDFEVQLPKAILLLKQVSREMNFSSKETIRNFRLVQTISLMGKPVEVWSFDFGFVIPGSTNSWQCIIEAADTVIPAEVLSGNLVIETSFFDGDLLVSKSRLKVFYV